MVFEDTTKLLNYNIAMNDDIASIITPVNVQESKKKWDSSTKIKEEKYISYKKEEHLPVK